MMLTERAEPSLAQNSEQCPTCEHDGCIPVRFCVGCGKSVCVGCFDEHNNDDPPNDHTSQKRPE